MKCVITLAPSEWGELIAILADHEVRCEHDAANPDLKCLKPYRELDAARAKELRMLLKKRLQFVDEEESKND